MNAFQPVEGRCECGAVRFRVHAPAEELYHCHCMRCRRLHGTMFATYAFVPPENVVIEKGADNLQSYRSPNAEWRFCRTCGCHLFAERPGAMWYMPATLDDGANPGHPAATEKHIFVESKLPWERIGDGLPQYDGYAPPELSPTSRSG